MIQRPSQRVAIFIDTQNMYHSAKHLYGARVNFPALVEAAVGSRELVRAIAYVAKSKTGEETAFFEALTSNGIELKVKDVQEFASGEKKADWDVGMAVDAMAISSRVDVVILVTGDGDFIPLVQYLKSNGIVCEAVAFGSSTNNQLREAVDNFVDLSEDPTQFLLQSRGRNANLPIEKERDLKSLENMFDPIDFGVTPPPTRSHAPSVTKRTESKLPDFDLPPVNSQKIPRGRKPLRSSDPSPDATPSEPSTSPGRNIRVTF